MRTELEMSAFNLLLRAHDHVWLDRTWPLKVRVEACQLLWRLALELLEAGAA